MLIDSVLFKILFLFRCNFTFLELSVQCAFVVNKSYCKIVLFTNLPAICQPYD